MSLSMNARPADSPSSESSPGNCPICASPRVERFRARVLQKHDVRYFFCSSCGLLQTETPYWLEEAYSSVIADTDTGLVSRNIEIARKLTSLLYCCLSPNADYVEFAGGYGLLTRLMRDRGFNFYWHDPYCENVFARGFEWSQFEGAKTSRAVTAFEVLEHTPDPVAFFREALQSARTSTVIFSTITYDGDPPPPDQWWYYSLGTGQHISFFRRQTLATLAAKLGLHFHTNGWIHVFTVEKLNSTLFRLATGRLAYLCEAYARRKGSGKTFEDSQTLSRRG
jgi:2-polyprenyl-3-methyl-5-hydroxy-6-metoxy-1,4-benzoquinol methylase